MHTKATEGTEAWIRCNKCGQLLPAGKFERRKDGGRRKVCNHCKWMYYVQPSRKRRILRELEARQRLRYCDSAPPDEGRS